MNKELKQDLITEASDLLRYLSERSGGNTYKTAEQIRMVSDLKAEIEMEEEER